MGEAKRRRTAAVDGMPLPDKRQAVVTDVEEVGLLLAAEKTYCDQCGKELPLWPPDLLLEHLHTEHAGMYWPTAAEEWDAYQRDTDLARRQNYITGLRVKFLFIVLQNRFDLYGKLVAAGCIVAPAQG